MSAAARRDDMSGEREGSVAAISQTFLDSLDTLTAIPAPCEDEEVLSEPRLSMSPSGSLGVRDRNDLLRADWNSSVAMDSTEIQLHQLEPSIPIRGPGAMTNGRISNEDGRTFQLHGDDDVEEVQDDDDEQMDVIPGLDQVSMPSSSSNPDICGMSGSDVHFKRSQHSFASDGTDRSVSFASESTDFSPLQSPQSLLKQCVSEEAPVNCEHHLDAVGSDAPGVTLNRNRTEQYGQYGVRQFAEDDLSFFDRQLGRDAFLEELSKTAVDTSAAKSLASHRMSIEVSSRTNADIIKQGWLLKRGEYVRSWHKRYFTLRRMPQGTLLTYSRDDAENAPAKIVELGSTSRCVIATHSSKKFEFRIHPSADSSGKEFAVLAKTSYEMTQWVSAIESAISAANKSAFEGSSDFERIWNEMGIQGFLVTYGIRKVSVRTHLQTRVLELNFADQTITNSRRGESLDTLHFNDLVQASATNMWSHGREELGCVLAFHGRRRAWSVFLDSKEARDDLMCILEKIMNRDVTGEDLEHRCSKLWLKRGFLERKDHGPQATLKGRLFACLRENAIFLYPDSVDIGASRPWYVIPLKGLRVFINEAKCLITFGRLRLTCASVEDCRAWYGAVAAAISMPSEVVHAELLERRKIRSSYQKSVFRLRKLLKANVQPQPNGPPKEQKAIELLMRKLWGLSFPGEEYNGAVDQRWQELGFQRGGPASDLRSSGLLGLYCLIYFVAYPSGAYQRILARTRFGVSDGNWKNYPLAIGCINVVAILIEMFGFSDAGNHAEGCSVNAMKTYALFVANAHSSEAQSSSTTTEWTSTRSMRSYDSWEDIARAENHVFEDMFCILFPVLDMLFVEMGAGYMEFGQVVVSFRRRLGVIFDARPQTMAGLQELAAEYCTDTLVEPSIVSKAHK